jgi:hypothetical protein
MKAIKGCIKGMNQDGTQSKEDANSAFRLDNFRIVTDAGRSTGSLENEKGHTLSFTIPDIDEMELEDGTIIPAQSNLSIIGWGTIVDTIVLFTTSENNKNPGSSYGQIWKVKFDETSGDIENIATGGLLTVANHLVYNHKLNFSTYHRIGRVVGRYENSETQRVYWTDNYNPVRVINIADTDSLNIPLDNIDLIPGVDLTQPVVQSIGTGNIQSGTMIQFSYRLIDDAGAETLSAPVSALYPVPEADVYSGGYKDFIGNTGGTTKSVTYIIKGIDTSFKTIEHIAILYRSPDSYIIYKFAEAAIPSNGELTVTCSDLDDATILTSDEFNMLSSGFDVAKDIEVKDNRLIAANIRTKDFNPIFDARAYRFNSSQNAVIKDSGLGDITINGVTKLITSGPGIGNSWTSIDEEHDAINPYNNESSPSWFSDQYKFQANGTTLGGEGPNVKYEFVTKALLGNTLVNASSGPEHVSSDRWSAADGDENVVGQLHADGSTYTIERTQQWKTYASPAYSAYFKSNARGEVYRYGIVFKGRRGSQSFVYWIGDIKFPDVEDGFPIQTEIGGLPNLHILGIKITVDTSSIANEIKGYHFVRVKREEKDKTRMGSGMFMFFDEQDDSYNSTILHAWEAANDATPKAPNNPYQITDDTTIFGSVEGSNFHLADKPGFQDPQFIASSTKRFGYILSPMGQLYNVGFKAGDFIKTTGYYNALCRKYHLNVSSPDDDKSYGFHYKLGAQFAPTHAREWYQIDRQQIMQTGQFYYSSDSFTSGYTGVNNLMNASYSRDFGPNKNVPLGLGSPKMAVMLSSAPTIQHNSGDPAATMSWNGGGDFRGIIFSGDISSNVIFKEVFYCRYISGQYGGNTFEERSQNQYISTNHYQAVNDDISTPLATEVWGGDVFINYYDDEQIQMYWNQLTAFGEPFDAPVQNKLSVAVMFPCESPCNADYREGSTFAASRDGANMSAYESNDYLYNFVWSQENTTEQKYFAKDFQAQIIEEHPHQLWASETKTDGELLDRWRIFKLANKTEVNGVYGPINRIINWHNTLYFYQDTAFGTADIDEKTVVPASNGEELSLGSGGVFPHYNYLSTVSGTFHQFDVIATQSALYHYDARLKKVFRFSGGNTPLSDLKNMSSYFANEITGTVTAEDYTLRQIDGGPTGVHGEADFRYNRIFFTFLKPYFVLSTEEGTDYTKGQVVESGGLYYLVTENFTSIDDGDVDGYPLTILQGWKPKSTIAYNEMLDAFEGFYDFHPGLYLQYGRRLLSVSPFETKKVFEHNKGNYCAYYNQVTPYKSRIETILGDNGNTTKTFDNAEFLMELYDTNKNDIYNEPISRYRVENEYQNTGSIPFVNDSNIKRRMRTWRFYIGRDGVDRKSRIRSPWAKLTLEYDNNNNKRLVLHDIIYSYSPAPL